MSPRAIQRRYRSVPRGASLSGLMLGFILSIVVLPVAAQSPARIRLRPERSTIHVGDNVKIWIDFLDRGFQAARNDRKRSVTIAARGIGTSPGQGAISPTQAWVGPGSTGEVTFIARAPGKIEISATAPGLSVARIVLNVVRQVGHGFTLVPRAYAQSPIRVEILPKDNSPIPANGVSRAVLYVTLDRMLQAGEQLLIRFQTIPGCTVLYEGSSAVAVSQIAIREGNAQSKEIYVFSKEPGTVRVTAKVVSPGPGGQDQMDLRFERPRPARVMFDDQPQSFDSSISNFPVTVRLGDQDQQSISAPQRPYQIRLQALSDLDVVRFDPEQATIAPNHSSVQTLIRLNGAPASGNIVFQATEASGQLEPAQKTIALNSYLQSVILDGPKQVKRGRTVNLVVRFADRSQKYRKADWARTVELNPSDGFFEPAKVTVPQGGESVQVTYHASDSIKFVTLTGDSIGLDRGTIVLQVIAPLGLLLLWGAIGGMVGGFFRLTKEKIQQILPKKIDGYWELGLLVKTGSSFIFGIVMYLVVRMGIVAVSTTSGLDGTRSAAFVFGVIGGFAGVYLLEVLSERILGKPSTRTIAAGGTA